MSTTIVDDDVDDEDDDDDDDDDDDVVGGGVMISITYQCLPLLSVWTTPPPTTSSKAYLFWFLHLVSRSNPSRLKFPGLLSRYSVAVREQNTLFAHFVQSRVINFHINNM